MTETRAKVERERIDEALRTVSHARHARIADAALGRWADWVKRLQCARFELQYADLLAHPKFGPATRFFLNDLYAPHDFSKRDAQFARISSAIERLFPKDVAQTATMMAQLHALSESLDNALASALKRASSAASAQAYRSAWHSAQNTEQRERQLRDVIALGERMDELTRRFGLRTALSLMRAPARAAGLSELQGFLERGFDAFAAMGEPQIFLSHIRARETGFLHCMAGQSSDAAAVAWNHLEQAAARIASPD